MKVYLKAFLDNGHVCYIDCDGFAGIYIYMSKLIKLFVSNLCSLCQHTYTQRETGKEYVCLCACVCMCVCVCVYERKTEPQRGRRMKGGEVREGKRK